jgi:putative toxin-antitoxin system antitoxin component (TIGR02293 family)
MVSLELRGRIRLRDTEIDRLCHPRVSCAAREGTSVSTVTSTRLDRLPAQAVERIETVLGLTPRELAFVMDTDLRTVDRWRTNDTHPQRGARSRLAELVVLSDSLAEVFGDDLDAVRDWLNAPSHYLGGLRPIEAIRARRVDLAATAIEALRSGVFI